MNTTTKVGDRVRLVFTSDEWTNLKPGDEGTVRFIDSYGTCHVLWDNGSSLGLVSQGEGPHDRWEVIK